MNAAAPGVLWSFVLIAIFIALQSLTVAPIVFWEVATQREAQWNATIVAGANGLAFAGTVALAVLLCKKPWRVLLSWRPLRAKLVPQVLLMTLGMGVIASEVDNLTRYILPMPSWVAELTAQFFTTGNPLGTALALVVVAPLTEEFLCRRWLLASLLEKWPAWRAIVVSAAVFGAMHMNPWQFFCATVLGIGVGWLYWRTRSVGLCIFWHGVNNSLFVLFSFWQPDVPGLNTSYAGPVEFHPWWLNATGVLLLSIGGAWVWYGTRDIVAKPPPIIEPPLLPAT